VRGISPRRPHFSPEAQPLVKPNIACLFPDSIHF
jgi:hypothetical protein